VTLTLTELANRHRSDKGTTFDHAHGYTEIYERIFAPVRERPLKLLEIGLCIGSYGCPSLAMWADYFPHATIHGFDIRDFQRFATDRVAIFRGDQTCEGDLERFIAEHGAGFDVIVDDGRHTSVSQQIALKVLFVDALAPGGLYVIEDLHYQPEPEPAGVLPTKELLARLARGELLHYSFLGERFAAIRGELASVQFGDSRTACPAFSAAQKAGALALLRKRTDEGA
jgi:hypothetical protein